jgi:hypothetical protein
VRKCIEKVRKANNPQFSIQFRQGEITRTDGKKQLALISKAAAKFLQKTQNTGCGFGFLVFFGN